MMPNRRSILTGFAGLGASRLALPSTASAGSTSYARAVELSRSQMMPSARDTELVRFATLAANSHNSQPWLFSVSSAAMTIAPDFSRRCPSVDPDDHHLYASLGCALENVTHAAPALGLSAVPRIEGDAIEIAFEQGPEVRSALCDAVTRRASTRAKYDGRPVAGGSIDLLEKACREPGVSAIFITDRSRMSNVADYVVQGNSAQMRDKAFMDELIGWMRFNESDAVETMDGLFAGASGNPTLPRWIARPMLRFFFTENRENEKYRDHIASSAGIVILSSDADDKTHWIAAGRACQRFGLQATALGLKYAFINQPVEVSALREQFASFLGLAGRRPDIVMRFGTGPDLPKSLRRPPESVLRRT